LQPQVNAADSDYPYELVIGAVAAGVLVFARLSVSEFIFSFKSQRTHELLL
jgi:hypothetical protein